ncbi:MAG: HAMP domain-containing histidine kinase [Acetobacteraceae bacterium]|nr:HAMP domain-containing histidine kinase [Acetobacteraceae bacterium]MBV8523332.1 HAMP domain-containing histidine kinase [Acetobacteraceae bacterium]
MPFGVSAVLATLAWLHARPVLARQQDPFATEARKQEPMPIPGNRGGLAEALDEVLLELEAEAVRHLVRLDTAVEPALPVIGSDVIRQIVAEPALVAIRHSPCGRVLVAVAWHFGDVQIAVLGNGPVPEGAGIEALRRLERLVRLEGGTIETRPDEGVVAIIRLPTGVLQSTLPPDPYPGADLLV